MMPLISQQNKAPVPSPRFKLNPSFPIHERGVVEARHPVEDKQSCLAEEKLQPHLCEKQ